MKILAYAGSTSKNSINKKLVSSTSKYYKEIDDIIEILDLNDYQLPIFSVDNQQENGIPENALAFAKKIDWADLILISLAEHNGNYPTAYKNIYDWTSRIQGRKLFNGKPILLLSTSEGIRGAESVLNIAKERMPRDGAEIIDSFSLPEFSKNFQEDIGIITPLFRSQLEAKVRKTKRHMEALLNKAF